jgi:hypothetical protein
LVVEDERRQTDVLPVRATDDLTRGIHDPGLTDRKGRGLADHALHQGPELGRVPHIVLVGEGNPRNALIHAFQQALEVAVEADIVGERLDMKALVIPCESTNCSKGLLVEPVDSDDAGPVRQLLRLEGLQLTLEQGEVWAGRPRGRSPPVRARAPQPGSRHGRWWVPSDS